MGSFFVSLSEGAVDVTRGEGGVFVVMGIKLYFYP